MLHRRRVGRQILCEERRGGDVDAGERGGARLLRKRVAGGESPVNMLSMSQPLFARPASAVAQTERAPVSLPRDMLNFSSRLKSPAPAASRKAFRSSPRGPCTV